MATEQNLSENDLDLLLSQSLGNALGSRSSFSELQDSLIDQLVEFKKSERSYYENHAPNSGSIWEAIEAETKAKVTPLFQRPITYTWAAAAVLLIAAFFGFYWISLNPNPQLVAQSDSAISTIILDDGTEVILRPYSELYEIAYSETERTYSLNGEAFFDVTSDVNRPFSVQAGEGVITVLGTRFNVSNWGNTTQVYLEEGSVQFTSSTKTSVLLEPGQQSELISGILSQPEVASSNKYTDWISNTIVFSGSLPLDVVAEIGQHFNIRINISQLNDDSALDGTLRLDSVTQTLEDLGLVLGGTFRKVSENEFTFIALD
tara:strand:- start:23040 stop:23993 length:954 start_codon:yes stop_codon:yes gene_type:complete